MRTRLARLLTPSSRLLELGGGTGTDAAWLAAQGYDILTTDASPAMLAETHQKLATYKNAQVAQLDLNTLPTDAFCDPVEVVFSNFGVLNCVASLPALSSWLADRMPPDSFALFVIMGRYCVWETLWHGLHGDLATAQRRRHPAFYDGIEIFYPTVAEVRDAFEPHFHMQHIEPLGLFLPPSDVYGALEKRPRWLRILTTLDDSMGRRSIFANYADHFMIELRRA